MCRIWIVVCGLLAMSVAAAAQRSPAKFFVYIQDAGGTPFYLRSGDSLMSSAPSGYLILPGLVKGDYHITIGFPRNEAAEASFKITLDGSDRGFLLRKDEKGLLNLYALKDFKPVVPTAVASAPGNRIINVPTERPGTASIRQQAVADSEPVATTTASPAPVPAKPAADDTGAFSRMLSEITGTTASPEPMPDASEQIAVSKDSTSPLVTMPAEDMLGVRPAGLPVENRESSLSRATPEGLAQAENSAQNSGGHEPQFITFQPDASSPQSGALDTALEARKMERKQPREQQRVEREAAMQEAAAVDFGAAPPAEPSASIFPEHGESADTVDIQAPGPDQQPLKVNSDCQRLASSSEFQKARRKMASRSDEEGMFRIAQKYLTGGDCFLASQIQSLAYLFVTDTYKYKFLELAYPHVADPANFSSLVKALGTAYYRKRFQAMIR